MNIVVKTIYIDLSGMSTRIILVHVFSVYLESFTQYVRKIFRGIWGIAKWCEKNGPSLSYNRKILLSSSSVNGLIWFHILLCYLCGSSLFWIVVGF